jgi:hypothetical protein
MVFCGARNGRVVRLVAFQGCGADWLGPCRNHVTQLLRLRDNLKCSSALDGSNATTTAAPTKLYLDSPTPTHPHLPSL